MNEHLSDLSQQLTLRPFTAADIQALRQKAVARQLSGRIAVSLKEKDLDILNATIAEFKRRNPDKAGQYSLMWEKTFRDMRMNLRYCLQCVALDDANHGKQVAWWWFRTILKAFDFDNAFIEQGYRILQEEVRKALAPEEAEPIARMIDEMIATLCYDHAAELSSQA